MKTQKFISATTAAVASVLSVGAAETAPQRPNIVLFMVDDMGWQDTSVPFYKERTPQTHLSAFGKPNPMKEESAHR